MERGLSSTDRHVYIRLETEFMRLNVSLRGKNVIQIFHVYYTMHEVSTLTEKIMVYRGITTVLQKTIKKKKPFYSSCFISVYFDKCFDLTDLQVIESLPLTFFYCHLMGVIPYLSHTDTPAPPIP